MSLKQIDNSKAPVFDLPPEYKGTGFFIRRLMSLAGKPVLAEKNLPIRPSANRLAAKCYISSAESLYRQHPSVSKVQRFKAVIDRLQSTRCLFNEKAAKMANPAIKAAQRQGMPPILTCQLIDHYAASVATGIVDQCNSFINRLPQKEKYVFFAPKMPMLLQGLKTRLKSLKYAKENDIVSKTSKNTTYQPSIRRRANSFHHFFQQYLFSDRYQLPDQKFEVFSPLPFSSMLYPGNYDFLSIVSAYRCGYRICREKPEFSARICHNNANFENKQDFARNLVIEYHNDLAATSGINLAKSSQADISRANWQNLRESPINQAGLNLTPWPIEPAETGFKPISKLNNPKPGKFAAVAADKNDIAKIHQAINKLFLKLAYNSQRSRMRLRLKIERAVFAATVPAMHQLINRQPLPVNHPTPITLTAFYPTIRAHRPDKKLPCVLPAELQTPASYTARRSNMRFLSARHVRYCRTLLKYCQNGLRQSSAENRVGPLLLGFASPAKKTCRQPEITGTTYLPDPAQVLYARPLPFTMTLTAMDFTDIILPESKRRCAPCYSRFVADFTGLISRRRNTLRTLRFKLFRLENALNMPEMKAPRYVMPKRNHIPLAEAESLPTKPAYQVLVAKLASRPYSANYRGRLEKFTPGSAVANEITKSMALTMTITGKTMPMELLQKSFIEPASWSRQSRALRGRVSLPPHPFGFPEFILPVECFNTLESAITFAYRLFDRIRIKISQTPNPVREKVFLPPLSLKNPKRFLYPQNATSFKALEQYQGSEPGKSPTINKLENIGYFAHDWGLRQQRTLSLQLAHATLIMRCRKRSCQNFVNEYHPDSYQLPERPLKSSAFSMPSVKRLILRCQKYLQSMPASGHPEISQIPIQAPVQSPDHQLHIKVVEIFHRPDYTLKLFKPASIKFELWSTEAGDCANKNCYFKLRMRTYSFPWRPEHTSQHFDANYHCPEEPLLERMTFLDQIGTEPCFIAFACPHIACAHAGIFSQTIEEFVNDHFATRSTPKSLAGYLESLPEIETHLDYERMQMMLKIEHSEQHHLFSRSILRLLKPGMKKFKPGSLPANLESRIEFVAPAPIHFPARLAFDHLHWIILLRNFVDLNLEDDTYRDTRKISSPNNPAFTSMRAWVSSSFHDFSDDTARNLQPSPVIVKFKIPSDLDNKMMVETDISCVTRDGEREQRLAFSTLHLAPTQVLEPENELLLSYEKRPEYRRNLQLYILHMAIDIDDYDLYTRVAEKNLIYQSDKLAAEPCSYRYPQLPEWLDLPQILEKRRAMNI